MEKQQENVIHQSECLHPINSSFCICLFSSTRIAESVTEEDRRLTKRLSKIIISDCSPSEEESSFSEGQEIPIGDASVSTKPRLERSLSKSLEDLSSK